MRAMMSVANTLSKLGRGLVVTLLGLVLPAVLLGDAYIAIKELDQGVAAVADLKDLEQSLPAPMRLFKSPNDYVFLSSVFLESGAQRVALNRLRMKVATVHVGFALMCVGLLFVLAGIDPGGVEIGTTVKEGAGASLKTASGGAAILFVGALIAAAGGLAPSTYKSGSVPQFGEMAPSKIAVSDQMVNLIKACISDAEDDITRKTCIANAIGGD